MAFVFYKPPFSDKILIGYMDKYFPISLPPRQQSILLED